jgi:hypothetical protein
MEMARGTKEPRYVVERAITEIAKNGGIWGDALTFYPMSTIIGYRLVEMDMDAKLRIRRMGEGMKFENTLGRASPVMQSYRLRLQNSAL